MPPFPFQQAHWLASARYYWSVSSWRGQSLKASLLLPVWYFLYRYLPPFYNINNQQIIYFNTSFSQIKIPFLFFFYSNDLHHNSSVLLIFYLSWAELKKINQLNLSSIPSPTKDLDSMNQISLKSKNLSISLTDNIQDSLIPPVSIFIIRNQKRPRITRTWMQKWAHLSSDSWL